MKETEYTLGLALNTFTYDSDEGFLYRDGKLCGGNCKEGKTVGLGGKRYEYHRVCFALYYKRWPLPDCVIDHINRNPRDNMISNLREVTKSVNGRNTKPYSNNKNIGIAGITFDKSCGYFRVRCGKHYIGITKDFFEACCMRKSFEVRSGDFTNNHFKAT